MTHSSSGSKTGEAKPRVLVADDDPLTRMMIRSHLTAAGYSCVTAEDGEEALRLLEGENAPRLAILDWMMPRLDGIEVCRRLRRKESSPYAYLILLTSREKRADLIAGLEAGADDYLTKPFDPSELRCRVRAGARILSLQQYLEHKVEELEDALAHVKRLQGLLPICMHCKSVRDDANTWHGIEAYLQEHGGLLVTHSLCQSCLEKHYPEYASDDVPPRNPNGDDRTGA